jgi:formylglycine-generating enzyme required for sulfatase activity
VVGVSWNEACEYAAWAGKQLPTEAQWEFAARGRGNRRYPWGHLDPDSTRCNFGDYLGMPSIVSMHEGGMTPEGIQDLAGNVYEWTEDAFEPYRHRQQGGGESDSPRRVVRGGSWHSGPLELVCSHRKGLFPESRLTTVGFRCVVPARTAH